MGSVRAPVWSLALDATSSLNWARTSIGAVFTFRLVFFHIQQRYDIKFPYKSSVQSRCFPRYCIIYGDRRLVNVQRCEAISHDTFDHYLEPTSPSTSQDRFRGRYGF